MLIIISFRIQNFASL